MSKEGRKLKPLSVYVRPLLFAAVFGLCACAEITRPKIEPFFAETAPPPVQELRWSNGKTPKDLDPAKATAAPATDIVRAVYEGLTDIDSRNLRAVPAVAERWFSKGDHREWTFELRRDARWSNGDRIVADDFVRSWKRILALKDDTLQRHLAQNIRGFALAASASDALVEDPELFDPLRRSDASPTPPAAEARPSPTPEFAVVAANSYTLKVTLAASDIDFPKLVSHPIFRPVHQSGSVLAADKFPVTNGAFRVSSVNTDAILLERSDSYWNRKSVALERVRFVASANAETALAAYRAGELDVITNTSFEPAAIKLLAPFEDFRRNVHSGLNFYEFNRTRLPYDDRRVREALAIAVDRQRIVDADLEGQAAPATRLLVLGDRRNDRLATNIQKAKELLTSAGYPEGLGFPEITLVVNRNDTQQRVARSVVRTWKQNLNIDAKIVVKENAEMESVRDSGDFDLIRRGVVLPVDDELLSMAIMFGLADPSTNVEMSATPTPTPEENAPSEADFEPATEVSTTEGDALASVRAIPLYHPTAYALVKPYVTGFEINALDAPSLKETSIDSSWRPSAAQP